MRSKKNSHQNPRLPEMIMTLKLLRLLLLMTLRVLSLLKMMMTLAVEATDFVHPSYHPSTSRPMLGSVRGKAKNKDDEEGKITWMSSFRSLLLLLTLIKWQRCRLF